MSAPENVYPLSAAQRRLWLAQQLQPDSCAYTLGQVFRLTGPLDVDVLRTAVAAVVARHESLRSRFVERDRVPVRIVDDRWHGAVTVTTGECDTFLREVFARPFDLSTGPLLRVDVLREATDVHVLAVTAHHIVTDGVSANIILRELGALYGGAELDPPTAQYSDVVADDSAEDLAYWLDHIDGAPVVLPLPGNRSAGDPDSAAGRYVEFDLPDSLTDDLVRFARANSATLYMVAFAAYQVLLSRLTGEPDLLVGMPVMGRTTPGSQDVVGFFINTLPVRADLRADPSFAELLAAVRTTVFEAFMRQDVPIDRIVEAVNPPRTAGVNPLIQTTFQLFEGAVGTELELPGLAAAPVLVPTRDVPFDLSMDLYHVDGQLRGLAYHRRDAVDDATMDTYIDAFRAVLRAVVDAPDCPASELCLTTPDQFAELATLGTGPALTRHAIPALHQLSTMDDDRVVIVADSEIITAARLRSDVLRAAGLLPADGVVGVPGPLSYTTVVGALGAWAAGAVVSPGDAEAADVVFAGALGDPAPATFDGHCRPDDVALLLPAERSSVVVTHGAFAALLAEHLEDSAISAADPTKCRVLVTPDVWTTAPWQPLLWVLGGAEVHIGSDVDDGFDVVETATTTVRVPTRTAAPARYGPIECLGRALRLPTGDPANCVVPAGVRIRVLDPVGRPVPVGVVGEICVGGDHLALGHAGDSALTAATFMSEPLSDDPAARLVRTGHRGLFTSDGRVWLSATGQLATIAESVADEEPDDAPRGGAEQLVAAVMAHVLGVETLGRTDTFFEHGGHSVLAVQLVARLRSMLAADVSVRMLFDNPTVAGMAQALARTAHLPVIPPRPVVTGDRAPVSFAQLRLWFIHQLDTTSTAYNMYEPVRVRGALDLAALDVAVHALVARHESLRTRFGEIDGVLSQIVDPDWRGRCTVVDVDDEDDVRDRLAMLVDTPFDLVAGPLFRMDVLRAATDDHVLVPAMHHIVSDGHSITLLMRDLSALYNAAVAGTCADLPVLPVRYCDYATWQRDTLQGEVLDGQLSYWVNQIGDAPRLLPLPADHRPAGPPSVEGGVARFELPPEITARLREQARGHGATLFMVTLAAFEVLLARISGERNFLVGVPVAGRTHPELEELIGFFVNTLALRADLRDDPTFAELVDTTRDRVLAGFAHQDLPFERLVEAVNPERVTGTNPLVQVTFHLFEDDLTGGLDLAGAVCEPVPAFNYTARFDLALDLFRIGNGLSGSLYYRTDTFTQETAQRIADCYRDLLLAVLGGSSVPVSGLPIAFENPPSTAMVPAPVRRVQDEFQPPRGATEQVVAGVMAEVLGLDRVGRCDDFFVLGGHSLRAVQLAARLQAVLQADVTIVDVFDNPTVDTLAVAVADAARLSVLPLRAGMATDPDPVSYAQQRLWFLQQLEPDSVAYNMYSPIRVHGRLDRVALRTAVHSLVDRHEALRTRFVEIDGALTQIVDERWASTVTFVADRTDIRSWLDELVHRPFDLSAGPLFRVDVLTVATDDHIVTLSMHHILSDGRSMTVLLADLSAFYNAAVTGVPADLAPLPVRYADFAAWQRQMMQGDVLDRHLRYWTDHVAGAPHVLRLPTDVPAVDNPSTAGGAARFELPAALTGQLRDLARECDSTLFMVVLSAFQALLSRLTGQSDLLVGVPVAGRTQPEVEDVIGFFINTLPVRSDVGDDPLFAELVGRTRDHVLAGFAHQELPFDRLIEAVNPERVLGANPLVQATCQLFEEEQITGLDLTGTTSEYFPAFNQTARFDLSLDMFRVGDSLRCVLYFRRDLLSQRAADRIADAYRCVLETVVDNAWQPVSALPLAAGGAVDDLLRLGEGPVLADTNAETILELFADQLADRPAAVAVADADEALTFEALDELVTLVAAQLRRRGVRSGDFVALAASRTPRLIAGILGVLRAGAVLVPLDPEQPADRLRAVVDQARPTCVLVDGRTEALAGTLGLPALDLRVLPPATFDGDQPAGTDLAYVVFTSGSTGTPKGVLVEHRNLVNLVRGHLATQYRDAVAAVGRPRLRVAHTSSITFDAAWDQLLWLIAGHELHIIDDDTRRDTRALVALLAERRIDVLNTTPSFMTQLVHDGLLEQGDGRPGVLVLGGEAVRPSLWSRLRAEPGIHAVNCYGPTECTVDALIGRLADSDRPVVGRAIPGTRVLILDTELRPVPIGVVGQIHLGGAHVARGYLGDPELTAQRFVDDPFRPGERLYRTGDLGRFTAAGDVEFLGRADRQLKIRGYRIEPAEIESALLAQSFVRDAVVGPDTERENARLVAHVVPDSTVDDSELRGALVSSWQSVFENAHEVINASDSTDAAIMGWTDSFSGRAIPAPQMREWVDTTIDRILALGPRRVLEIGAGTGLLMDPLLRRGEIERYVATDFSEPVLDVLRRTAHEAGERGCRAEITVGRAEAVHAPGTFPDRYDTVVVNSVAQYFPSVSYLATAVGNALDVVTPGGHVFLGDLRNAALIEAFAVLKHRLLEPTAERQRLAELVARELRADGELSIDPAVARLLLDRFPTITAVEIAPRRGEFGNEMTLFRYDVVLHVGCPAEAEPVTWTHDDQLGLGAVERALAVAERPFGYRDVGNARLDEALRLRDEHGLTPTGASRRSGTGLDLEALWRLGERYGWQTRMSWAAGSDAGAVDVSFVPRDTHFRFADPVLPPVAPMSGGTAYPLFAPQYRAALEDTILGALRQTLPDYLVPAEIVFVPELPRLVSGKVDVAALPRARGIATRTGQRVGRQPAAQTPLAKVVDVFARSLRTVVLPEDDFFALGGDSLTAGLCVRELRSLELAVSIRDLFEHRTPARIAAMLGT